MIPWFPTGGSAGGGAGRDDSGKDRQASVRFQAAGSRWPGREFCGGPFAIRPVKGCRPHLGNTPPLSGLLLHSVCAIFTEDRLHLGKTTSQAGCFTLGLCYLFKRQTSPRQNNHASGLFLHSVCAIFTEDRLHLGKTTPQAGCFCTRFVLSLPQTNLAI